jgi:hypothetical protein
MVQYSKDTCVKIRHDMMSKLSNGNLIHGQNTEQL